MSDKSSIASSSESKPSRLGRGLADLIGEQSVRPDPPARSPVKSGPAGPYRDVQITALRPNPKQPRRTFNEAELDELASSIRAKGVLQAILVRPDPKDDGAYQIVAGERRWRAAQRAGLKTVPVAIRNLDELEVLEIGIIENVQRADLNPIEEAEAYQALMKRFGRTQEMLAEQVGKSRPHIANTLRLLNLPDDAKDLMREGQLSAGHARAALSAPEPAVVIDEILHKGLTVREAEKLAQKLRAGPEDVQSNPSEKVAAAANKDVDTEALETDLAHALGLDVEIRHKGNRGGELRISYRRLEQLDDICRRLTSGGKPL